MILLVLFAFVAGAATALSPCVLPVLPVAVAAGATGGPRRPLGVVTGLALSFTFATVALIYVLSALGLPDDLLRSHAIVVLALAGAAYIVPGLGARAEAALTRLARRPPAGRSGDGFASGFGARCEPRPRLRALRGRRSSPPSSRSRLRSRSPPGASPWLYLRLAR